jgi:hypothetical protein
MARIGGVEELEEFDEFAAAVSSGSTTGLGDATIAMERQTAGKTNLRVPYYLHSAPLTPERFNELVCSH